ncbi:MAG: tripartite tricarboxylate transporter substrate binding protein [Proteobacteria bacterium]|nr:tripartite tricarboxylate transporter substrate binding protein [Pseudomonadota bacterium]
MNSALSMLRSVGLLMTTLTALNLAWGTAAVAAEKYPTKAVTVIHGFKPGGGSDQLSSVTQPVLEKILKQRFVNVYKPGADGAIAWKEVGKDSKPDGYTLTTVLTPKTQLNSMVNRDAGYTMADFEPIANMIFDPGILVVAPDSKYKSLNDLVDAAKKAPGSIRLSHSGEGGDDWYNALMIEKLTGAKFNLVPFDGDAPAMQAAMGGHVDACTTNVGVVTGLVRGKKLRGLAVYTPQRLTSISEVPTLRELGVNLVEGSYRGYLAPKGTPKEIIKILADALEKVSKDPQFLEASAAINMVPQFKRDQELKTFLDEQDATLRKVAKEMKLIQ